MKAPTSAALMKTACAGFGTWTVGYLCEDAATPLVAVFGGNNLIENAASGSPVYQVPGPLDDKAVRVTVANTGWAAVSTAFLDVDNTKDICGAIVMRTALPLSGGNTTILSKDDFAGGPGYELAITSTQVTFTADHSTPGNVIATAVVPDSILSSNEWFVVMWAMDRGTTSMRIAIRSLTDNVQSVGVSQSIASVGSLTNTSPFRLGRAGAFGNTFEVAALYVGAGVGAAAGMSAGIDAALTSFTATIVNAPVTVSSTLPAFDYIAHARSRLPHMYRSRTPAAPTNTEKALAARLAPANQLGAVMRAVLTQRTVDNAVGAQLDVLGALVGRARQGVDDDEIYRRYIRAQIVANKSDGVTADILAVARAVIGAGGTIVNSNTGAAAYVLRVEGLAVADDVAAVLVELVLQATSDGVRAVIEWSSAPPATTLYWDTQGVWDTAVWFNAADREL